MYIKRILVVIVLLIAMGMGAVCWYIYDAAFSPNTTFNNARAHVFIPTNASPAEVLGELEPLLENIETFKAVANQKGYLSNIKPGHFIIDRGMGNNDIVNMLRSRNIPINVKFNNQERLENLAGNIANQIEADSVSLLEAMRDPEFLKEAGLNEDTA